MSARETVIERVTRIADDTSEREEYAADLMQKIIGILHAVQAEKTYAPSRVLRKNGWPAYSYSLRL